MGAEPYLVASVLEGVLAQRLGRRICSECATQEPMPEVVEHRLSEAEKKAFKGKVWRGTGCSACNNSGYRGRVGFFELLTISGELRRAISENRSMGELKDLVPADFRTMRAEGIEKAASGISTIEEVLRATQDADDTDV